MTKDASALRVLWDLAAEQQLPVETVKSGWEALERVQSGDAPGLVLLDVVPGDTDSLHTLRWMRRVRPDVSVVLVSSVEDGSDRAEAVRLGADDYLVRPLEAAQLTAVLARYLAQARGEANLEGAEVEPLGDDGFFIAASAAMRRVRGQAELLGQVSVPVLIVGEPGSGKSTIARLIHKLSVRSEFRFLKVSCAALTGDLLEHELFGYHPNGNGLSKPGKLELCAQGTLLLEEITEMPLELQAKLLEVLQEKKGSGEARVHADVRIMATSSMPVEEALSGHKLREDLYYRLSSFTVFVPPLRQRREEVPLLLGQFMKHLAKRYGLPTRMFSPRVLDACQSFAWPGNLNELESFVKRYLVTGTEGVALSELENKSRPVVEEVEENLALTATHEAAPAASSLRSLVQSVKGETERNAIASALETTHWNRKAAARLLRVSYRTLLYKIQEYHMTPTEPFLMPSQGWKDRAGRS